MAIGTGGLSETKSDINVTPLIDVLLVLLIIFMIVTPVLTKAMDSEIPQKSDQPIPEQYSAQQLVVSITADGRYMLNKEELTLSYLPTRLRDVFEQRGGKKVLFLNADDSVPYGQVVQVMDICRTAGAETIAVVTESIQAGA
ncbi:MAG TPA: biopolymer transporter ExbD [Acidobacteriota bacterium]